MISVTEKLFCTKHSSGSKYETVGVPVGEGNCSVPVGGVRRPPSVSDRYPVDRTPGNIHCPKNLAVPSHVQWFRFYRTMYYSLGIPMRFSIKDLRLFPIPGWLMA
jgi:hypothetical protein